MGSMRNFSVAFRGRAIAVNLQQNLVLVTAGRYS